MELIKSLFGLAMAIALILFLANPGQAMRDTYATFMTPSPRIPATVETPEARKRAHFPTEAEIKEMQRKGLETIERARQEIP